jgi:hypothetical protein
VSSKTRSEQAVADTRGERDAKPSSIGDSARIGSTTAQMKPRLSSDRDQKGGSLGPNQIIELAAFRFSNHLR